MTQPLMNDMQRCFGGGCERKTECRRSTTMAIDPERDDRGRLIHRSYVVTMLQNGHCDNFIGKEK
jgi:hypothetical protein